MWNGKSGSDAFGNLHDDPGGTELLFRFVDPERLVVDVDAATLQFDHWTAIGGKTDFSARAHVTSTAGSDGHELDIQTSSPERPATGAIGFDVAGSIGVRYVASEQKVDVVLKPGDASRHPVKGLIMLSRRDGPVSYLKLPSATIVRVGNAGQGVGKLRFYAAGGAEIHSISTSKSYVLNNGAQEETKDVVFNETPSPIRVVVPIRRFATETVAFKGTVGLGF